MGHVYANATCTIAATASKDSSGGLFFDRCPELLRPRRVVFGFNPEAPWLRGQHTGFALLGTYLCDVAYLASRCVENAPLYRRAWVSQERQLSRRLLHFTSTQLFWECNECTACETYPERLPQHAQPWWQDDATILKKQLRDITNQDKNSSPLSAPGLDDMTYYTWCIYRTQYSRCALTRNTDKLVAIQGIANLVSQATGDQFIAGLWRSRIIEELCWIKEDPMMETVEWRAPTWSWASTNGRIDYSFLSKFHRGHTSRHIEAELIELDVRAKASGELEHASIKIKCKLLHAIFTPAAALQPPNNDLYGLLQLIDQGGEIMECRISEQTAYPGIEFHVDDYTKIMTPQYGYVVVLQHCLHEEECKSSDDIEDSDTKEGKEGSDNEEYGGYPIFEEENSLEALFLQMRDRVEGNFERIGLILFKHFRAGNQILRAHRMAEDKVITLV
jgi:hypothetical protein